MPFAGSQGDAMVKAEEPMDGNGIPGKAVDCHCWTGHGHGACARLAVEETGRSLHLA